MKFSQANVQVDILNGAAEIKWRELAPLPFDRTAHTAVLLRGSVYVGGGFEGRFGDKKDCYKLDVYNLTTNQWSLFPISTPTSWFAMTTCGNKLIIAGGGTKDGNTSKEVLFLDKGKWRHYSNMQVMIVHRNN